MSYKIEHNAPPAPPCLPQCQRSEIRATMEQLAVGDSFMVDTADEAQRASWARRTMAPRKFSVVKVPKLGWQVRRTL